MSWQTVWEAMKIQRVSTLVLSTRRWLDKIAVVVLDLIVEIVLLPCYGADKQL